MAAIDSTTGGTVMAKDVSQLAARLHLVDYDTAYAGLDWG